MMVTVLRVDPEQTTTRLELPDDPGAQCRVLVEAVGGFDRGRYHLQGLLHSGGVSFADRRRLILGVWALASTWRGVELYPLCGTIVVSGPERVDGGVEGLGAALTVPAEAALAAVSDVLARWRDQRPASETVARVEVLSGVRIHAG